MPRTNLLKNNKDIEIISLIDCYCTRRGVKKGDLIQRTGIKSATYYKNRNNPSLFRIGDLRRIYDYLRIPEEERVGV